MIYRLLLAGVILGFAGAGLAQLVDESQIGPTVPGGAIRESLEEQIGAGRGDIDTPLSAIYFIKRDPARAVRSGRQLFQRKFTAEQGVGPRVSRDSVGDITANSALGAGLMDSCAGCHGRPKGAAGHGGVVVTKPDSRDTPHLFGLGLQEMLADEMTAELRARRNQAIAQAQEGGSAVTADLMAKGVSFGAVTAYPDGTVDTAGVVGVNEDLRVRPFFAQGLLFSMREFIVGAFNAEMGLQAHDPDLAAASNGGTAVTPSGLALDGSADLFFAPPVSGPHEDGDGDGVKNEIDPAVVDLMEFYLLNYFKPGLGRQTPRTGEGLALMENIGCTTCHVQNLTIDHDRRVADVETVFDPVNGRFNRLFATAEARWVTVDDGNEHPQVLPGGGSFVVGNIFTDFKRHDLGPSFHERNYDGSIGTHFVTEPLWGVATTAPYGHDGRSISLEEVILRHGGEALGSRNSFAGLSDDDQRKVIEFLQTLVLFPPDDTASNLNPGSDDVPYQDPAGHGSIALAQLFQIEDPGSLQSTLQPGRHPGGRKDFSFFGAGGNRFEIQRSKDLRHWETIGTTNLMRGGRIHFEAPPGEDGMFFRLRQERGVRPDATSPQ